MYLYFFQSKKTVTKQKNAKSSNKSMKTPKKMLPTPELKRKTPLSEENARKMQKVDSPTKLVKIYPSPRKLSQHNENSPQKSNSLTHSESVENLGLGSFTPKKSPRSMSNFKNNGKLSPRKLFCDTEISEVTRNTIENLNMLKQGAIGPNNFDLEAIYTSKNYNVQYNSLKTDIVDAFELKDVIFPKETHANHLFSILTDVFSNVINCGYFDEKEIDLVFACLSMSAKAQMLLARLLKRKRTWYRINSIQYLEIDKDLNPYMNELVDKGFCDSSKFLIYYLN